MSHLFPSFRWRLVGVRLAHSLLSLDSIWPVCSFLRIHGRYFDHTTCRLDQQYVSKHFFWFIFHLKLTLKVVEDDAGADIEFCPTEGGPCSSWAGTNIFNRTTENGVLSIDTMWGPGSGWVIGVTSAIGSIIWVIMVALWGANQRIDRL